MDLSVEVEPPKGAFQVQKKDQSPVYEEVLKYRGRVDMISITNRPVFGLSPLTLASQIHKLLNKTLNQEIRINLHLTTRLSHFDAYKYILDAHRVGLSDLLPILGDPRGPNDENYFDNGFDILGFVSYLKTGNKETLTDKYRQMVANGKLKGAIEEATFNIGSVVDVNPTKKLENGKIIDIRERQIKFARKKEKLGAEYLISQGTFDADYYFEFVDEADLEIPILAGILPARTRLIDMFGLPISQLDKQRLRAQFTTDEERKLGNEITSKVYHDLIDRGCDLIHVYSIGNYNNFQEITGIELGNETGIIDNDRELTQQTK